MVLQNPTDSTVSVILDGTSYSVAPQSTVKVSDSVGTRWKKVHAFLQETEQVPPTVSTKVKVTDQKPVVVEPPAAAPVVVEPSTTASVVTEPKDSTDDSKDKK